MLMRIQLDIENSCSDKGGEEQNLAEKGQGCLPPILKALKSPFLHP